MTDFNRPYHHVVVAVPAPGSEARPGELLLPASVGSGDRDARHFVGLDTGRPAPVGRVTRRDPPVTALDLCRAGDTPPDPGRLTDAAFLLEVAAEMREGALLTCRYTSREGDVVWEVFGEDKVAGLPHWRGELAGSEPEPWPSLAEADAIAQRRVDEARQKEQDRQEAAARETARRARVAEDRARREAELAEVYQRELAREQRGREEAEARRAEIARMADAAMAAAMAERAARTVTPPQTALDPEVAALLDWDDEDQAQRFAPPPAPAAPAVAMGSAEEDDTWGLPFLDSADLVPDLDDVDSAAPVVARGATQPAEEVDPTLSPSLPFTDDSDVAPSGARFEELPTFDGLGGDDEPAAPRFEELPTFDGLSDDDEDEDDDDDEDEDDDDPRGD